MEGLVLAGAFDSINNNRAKMFAVIEEALEFGHKVKNSSIAAGDSLFGDIEEVLKISEPSLPPIEKWPAKIRLAKEREVIGFYVTGHPLSKYETEYKSFASIHLGETSKLEDMDVVRACGVITALKTKIDKAGKSMAFFTLDDFSGSCETLMFSKIYEKYGQFVKEEECVFILGRPESSGDAIKLHIEEVIPLEEASDRFTQSVKIILGKESNSVGKISELKELLVKHNGNIPVYIHLPANGSKPRMFFLKDLRVKISREFIESVTKLLGEDSVILGRK
jgi:DNA polymerase-3 subunit alpha